MRTNSSRVAAGNVARSDLLERQLQRYRPPFQRAVRTLASRHSRVADLALSFPTLLFALAVPRPGNDPARAIALAIEGAPLAEVAAAAGVPLWLRKFPIEGLLTWLPALPDDPFFRRQIANHLPRHKAASTWLQAVSKAAEVADTAFAVWVAKEFIRNRHGVKLGLLRRVGLWSWFCRRPGTLGYELSKKLWTPSMQFSSACDAAFDWRAAVMLHANLGSEPIADMWLRPALVDGFYFRPLESASEIAEEADAMENCVRTYGHNIAHHRHRLWSMRRDGQRVATLELTLLRGDYFPQLTQIKGAGNSSPPFEVCLAARRWLNGHDLLEFEAKRRDGPMDVPFDRAAWLALWRPYWLAKQRFPEWLPLAPSRPAFTAL